MSQMTDTADIITNNDTDNTMNNDDSAIMAKESFDANVDKATIDDVAAAFGGNKNKTNNQESRNDPIANNIVNSEVKMNIEHKNNNINRGYPNFVKRQSTFDEDIDLSDGTLQIRLKDIPRFTYKKRDVYTLIEATLIKVNIGEQTFDCEIKFEFYWQQPELRKILNKKENQNRQFTIYDDQESIPIDLDDPFAGDMGLEVIEQEYRWDKRHNVVCLLLSVTDTFSERMELERFPCDRQFLNILLKGRIEYFNWLTIKPDWLNHIKCEHQITTIKGPSVSEYLGIKVFIYFLKFNIKLSI